MYEMMFYGGLVSFAVGLIVTIALFVRNDVGKVIGDLTGYNAKKAMKELQKKKEEKQQSGEPHEEQKKRADKDKKEKRRLRRIRMEKTDVLPPRGEQTDAAPEDTTAPDVLPVRSERQEQLLQQAQAVLASEEGKLILTEEKQETMDASGIFETEEDVTVFGGEVVTEMPTTVLSGKISFANTEAVPEREEFLQGATRILQEGVRGTHILPNGINALASDDEIEELLAENQELSHSMAGDDGFIEENDDFSDDDATDLLYDDSMEETSVLSDDDATELLYDDSMEETSVLADEEATELLRDDSMEATTVLSDDGATELLYDDSMEETSVLTEERS